MGDRDRQVDEEDRGWQYQQRPDQAAAREERLPKVETAEASRRLRPDFVSSALGSCLTLLIVPTTSRSVLRSPDGRRCALPVARPRCQHTRHLWRSERQAARPCVGRNARAHYRLNACRPATRQWQDGARDQGSGGATGSSDCWRQPRAQGMDVEYGIGLGEDRSGGHAAQQQRGSAGRHRGRGARATCARPLPRSLS